MSVTTDRPSRYLNQLLSQAGRQLPSRLSPQITETGATSYRPAHARASRST